MKYCEKVCEELILEKMMCIFRVDDVSEEIIVKAATSCVEVGAKFIEITYNHEGLHDKTMSIVKKIKHEIKDKGAYVGVGTVLTIEEAKEAIGSESDFIVAPIFDKEIQDYANEKDIYYMPGIFTASEACAAYKGGAKIVKLFPTGEVGLDYAKALMKPLGFIKYFAVGKMSPDLFNECLRNGFVGAGISSSINSKDILVNERYDEIKEKIKNYREIAQKFN
ncbi:bifunctional 4-hydroxy-2-oxoglutarate aldolase/2-dehydro-3-deoxy-phosphogluconate aldolase [Anaerorhabdus furcosa]|uniref:2-dehydro-3-deoxyphosphogluconate aldolase / (4S)-4-hydroxy-2-oxoglutarate aldolase n=1 Tax=Anaerorhabdus furcosa TaxID=118967 RepID=A0A1T4PXD8_9FIRM|nr:hypothetical protein [Anaerorhabdus furcosa]SJZ96165.1 2-dehydro-3-deoxyphosphogluconate aldolase / (4S)-4-hydroxy-2-oxoglutarate aldolase [Anaerorhabdus furcosa]